MRSGGQRRVRREAGDAKDTILRAAERRLIEEGPSGVKVQRIARDLGITDAAIHYHFKNQQGLLEAVLRSSGRRFVEEVAQAASSLDHPAADLADAGRRLSDLYGNRGAAKLALWLVSSGWSPPGEGMLNGLVQRLHESRARQARQLNAAPPSLTDSARLLAVMNAVAFAQALTGDALTRSANLHGADADDLLNWLAERLAASVSGTD